MTAKVSYFDLRARRQRRDELVEEAFGALTALKPLLETEQELMGAIDTIERVKALRRADVVAALEQSRMTRASS